jgi:hypothetical protein
MYDFEVWTAPTVHDIETFIRIDCLQCDYNTARFWSLRESEKDFWQHYMRKHGMK